jgi:hypothetical protein
MPISSSMSYLVYADTRNHTGRAAGRGLRASGWGEAKGQSPLPWGGGSSDPMIEAGVPSTGRVVPETLGNVPAPPGVAMLAPPELPRNAEGGAKAKAAPRRPQPRRDSPTPLR